MPKIYNSKTLKLYLGDCMEELKLIPDSRIDSIVTDPPYGIAFMGKDWDEEKSIAFDEAFWKECLRVAKPGAHLVAFGAARTYHHLATAIEKAGWEIRDSLHWLYGSGFPKSLDVSKAIDKAAGVEREIVGVRPGHENFIGRDNDIRFDKTSGFYRPWMDDQKAVDRYHSLTAPATDEAKQWKGWGTALKPSHEPIVLARKPLSEKTVAANVLKHGTGGLNIDASRIDYISHDDLKSATFGVSSSGGDLYQGKDTSCKFDGPPKPANPLGRWPANSIFSHSEGCIEVGVSESSSPQTAPKPKGKRPGGFANVGANKGDSVPNGPTYKGESTVVYECVDGCPVKELDEQSEGVSRFFYVAKPSKSEKNAGCEYLEDKLGGSLEGGNDKRRGDEDGEPQLKPTKNHHPTVKPVKLMEYLCNLITPPGGIVLDPFLGSGTTGIAAMNKGFRFVGIEREREYMEIAQARIENSLANTDSAA